MHFYFTLFNIYLINFNYIIYLINTILKNISILSSIYITYFLYLKNIMLNFTSCLHHYHILYFIIFIHNYIFNNIYN